MNFFTAKAAELFELMVELARKGTTIYPKSSYRKRQRA